MEHLNFSNLSQGIYLFHPRVIPTVIKNIDRLNRIFKDNGEMTEVFNFIKKAGETINESSLDLFLEQTNRIPESKDRYRADFKKVLELPDSSLDMVQEDLKNTIIKDMINELIDTSAQPKKFVDTVKTMDFSIGLDDVAHQNIEFTTMESINIMEAKDTFGKPIKSKFEFINKASPINGYIPNQLIAIAAAPATGKSNFAMDEFLYQIKQGYKPYYFPIGDLTKIDFITRLVAKWFNVSIDYAFMDLQSHSIEETLWSKMIKEIKEVYHTTFGIAFIKPDSVYVEDLYKIIEDRGIIKNYDIFFFDYDNNFASINTMYDKGNEVYQKLSYISRIPGKTVFVLSQIKSGAWQKDLIEEEDLGESRRKAEIADLVITLSKKSNRNRIGYMNIAKIRRGTRFYAPYFLDISGTFYQIDDHGYRELSATPFYYTTVKEGASMAGVEYRFFNIGNDGVAEGIQSQEDADNENQSKNVEFIDGLDKTDGLIPNDVINAPQLIL